MFERSRANRTACASAVKSLIAVVFLGVASGPALSAAALPPGAPDFAPTRETGWVAQAAIFIPPESGPGPVVADKSADRRSFPVGDLSNPILQPWAREEMRKHNEKVLAGQAAYTLYNSCWPIGVPGFLLYVVIPVYFIQTPQEVTMVWAEDHQVRRVFMNQPHSARVKTSWYGESVGHYEGDTLVVDTIGIDPRTTVDDYRTPHTDKLHVVERFRIVEGGKTMEVKLHVEDPGAFTTPWDAIQRYRRIDAGAYTDKDPRVSKVGLQEQACAENNESLINKDFLPMPRDDHPAF